MRFTVVAAISLALVLPRSAVAADNDVERYAVHAQFTYTEQETSNFNSPYRGPDSLTPAVGAETIDATLYAGARPWRGAEGWMDVEVDQGRGVDDTLGAAGFPSGEAYKVGKNQPYLRLTRLFLRQTLSLGGARIAVDADANQLAGSQSADRLVLQAGKFSVSDLFDASRYAHDPRQDFLNWTAVDAGTFDYAADAWGYTVGVAAQWYQGRWTLRGGLFDLSDVPNSVHLEPGFHEFQYDVELERRHVLSGHPGKLMITAFDSRGRMGLLDEAVANAALTGAPADIASVRRYRSRLGASLMAEQELTADLGFFLRAGKAAGNVEAYEFSDIDRTLAAGLSLQGARWSRPQDVLGASAIANGISASRERFLNAGGLGILVGDGQLPRPGAECLFETYYSIAVAAAAHLSFDYQWIDHPAYNRARGPASVFAVRLHASF